MDATKTATRDGAPETSNQAVMRRIFAENGRAYLKGYVFAIFCLVLMAGTTAFVAWIMEAVISTAFVNPDPQKVWLICLSIFLAFLMRGLATYGQSVTLSMIGNNIVANYQTRIYDKLMTLSIGFFSESRSAHLAAQINQNVTGIRDVLNMTVTSLARDFLTLAALVGVMVVKDPMLSLIIFVAAPPLIYAIRYVSNRLRTATRESIELNSHVLGAMQETVQGIAIVKAFTMEKELGNRLGHIIRRAEGRANRIARLSERTSPMTEGFAGLVISGVLGYAAYRSIYDQVPPGAFFSFVTALLMAYDPARRLAKLQAQVEKAVVNARMIYEILDLPVQQRDLPDARDLVISEARIEFRNVSFAYGTNEPVLKHVDLVAEGGRTTALVGPSGAGKSTIIALIPRFYDPSEGTILIDGQDIAHVTKASLRRHVAYVSQQPYLFEGTIRDNIRYGRPEATNAEIEEAARLANAHAFILAQPKGYDTPVGENGVTLSGGQRQRLSIARALVRHAPILLLDEATSALDTASEAAVQKALDEAMKDRTVVVIAHRLSTVIHADKIVAMQDGRVVEEGTHETLSSRPDGLYARLHSLQTPKQGLGTSMEDVKA